MLQSLQIENLALVDSLQIEFAPGLNAITGETGAGKSILVGALGLLLGERADKSVIREGEDQCVIEADFTLEENREIDVILRGSGLEACADGHLVIRRLVAASGTGRQFVNHSPATLQVLKKIGDLLVDMHGPHDHQSLFSPEFQLSLLDAFGDLAASRQAYREVYEDWQALRETRRSLEGNDQEVARQIDLLAFQVKELEAANLKEDEENAVIREQTIHGNAQHILQLAQTARHALTEGESSAFAALAVAQQAMGELVPLVEPAKEWKNDAKSAAMQVQELARALDSFTQRIEVDPARLLWLDERLATYQKLKRKYGATVPEVLELLKQSKQKLHDLKTRGEQLARLDAELAAIRGRMETQGGSLRTKRQAAAKRLEKAVKKELGDLGFPQAAFSVALSAAEASASGLDAVEFGFNPNPGEPGRPLRAIASSGEMSRVMLALKTVLADHDRIPILVFDEIDVNVGGKMGQAIGLKLAEIARRRQVICITHLPQVAVCGQTQFAVTKETRGGRTFSGIARLNREGRVDEIARMLGGRDMTSVTLKHAREMLEKAQG
jgi:DNA repair protein RecN (Recombination protein N)